MECRFWMEKELKNFLNFFFSKFVRLKINEYNCIVIPILVLCVWGLTLKAAVELPFSFLPFPKKIINFFNFF